MALLAEISLVFAFGRNSDSEHAGSDGSIFTLATYSDHLIALDILLIAAYV